VTPFAANLKQFLRQPWARFYPQPLQRCHWILPRPQRVVLDTFCGDSIRCRSRLSGMSHAHAETSLLQLSHTRFRSRSFDSCPCRMCSYRVKEPGFRGRFGDCNCSTGGPEAGDVPQVRLCQSHRQCSYTTNLILGYSPSYQILHPFPRSLTCPIVSGQLSAFATTSWLDHCLVTPEANKQL